MDTIILLVIDVTTLLVYILLCTPTYMWHENCLHKDKKNKFTFLLILTIFLIIAFLIFGLRSDILDLLNIKDYGVEYT